MLYVTFNYTVMDIPVDTTCNSVVSDSYNSCLKGYSYVLSLPQESGDTVFLLLNLATY